MSIILKDNDNVIQRFTIITKLGEGEQGVVYKCYNKNKRLICAIKKIKKSSVKKNKYTKELLNNEYNTHLNLINDNILRLYDGLKDENHYYLIYEYCPNGNLSKIKNKNFTLKKMLNYIYEAGLGLLYLKNNKILHLDIKLDNILIKNDVIKIADFGLCYQGEIPIKFGYIRGTPSYMSPEIVECDKVDYGTDLWSLGVCLYYILFNKFPFDSNHNDYDQKNNYSIDDVFENIKNIKLEYPKKSSYTIYINLLKKIFVKSKYRITIEEFLQDDVFKS